MELSNENKKFIWNLIFVAMVFTLAYVCGAAIYLKINIVVEVILSVVITLITKFLLFNPLFFYGLIIVSLLALITVNFTLPEVSILIFDKFSNFANNLSSNLMGLENINKENILILWVLLVTIIALFTAIILFKFKKLYPILPIYLLIFIFYWYNFFDAAYIMIALFLAVFLTAVGFKNYEKISAKVNAKHWMKTLVVYVFLIVFLAVLIPKDKDYIRWRWLEQKILDLFPETEDLRSYDRYSARSGQAYGFDLSVTGYKNQDKLGGPISLDQRLLMTVYSKEPTYLRGNTKDYYSGFNWIKSKYQYIKDLVASDISNVFYEDKQRYYTEEYMAIIYSKFASSTIFTPLVPKKIEVSGGTFVNVDHDYTINFVNGVYENQRYNVYYLKPRPYGELVALGKNVTIDDLTNSDIYLQIPNTITDRLKVLTSQIVENSNSPLEKAIAIETYLRNNFSYNLDVLEVPDGVDFIDHFIFETKEGYCTYFASAMAIMLRLEGIPTRYVEGFAVTDEIDTNIYEVRNLHAHAWVEAYIEPVGWMTFESTPLYEPEDRKEDFQLGDLTEEDIKSSIDKNNNTNAPVIDNNPETNIEDGAQNNTESSTKKKFDIKNLISVLSKVLFFLALFFIPIKVLIGFIRFNFEEKKARTLSNKDKIIFNYSKIMMMMEHLNLKQNIGETHYEYANRVPNKFYTEDDISIKEITDIFVKAKYGDISLEDSDLAILESYRFMLKTRLKNNFGKFRYVYNKYFKEYFY